MSSPTLTDKVSKMIHQDILNGELKPGQKLVVADLKQKYNVGASPIREALVQLSWTKYVSLEPQKGCWVAPVSITELTDLYESLRFVASVLIKQAIEAGDESWELDVLTSFHKLSRIKLSKEDFDWSEWEERQHQFHISLLEGAISKNMLNFFNDLINQVKRYRYYAVVNGLDSSAYNLDEYEMIMKLVLAKDADKAAEKFDLHLHRTMEQIQEVIEAAA
ncbi:GntR family transcriptional regulator [Vibrio aquaticus]|uniref:GntR family transcriptional regulator n=1 Tax=Vibrio aquaticus TaxID=2496559 RepID=A0A3S0N4C0_9VIBR|nr:GntR family transcriptional regulator [Vibrio aquaticus]RTZ14921.1 GntR family transcriptional regulator [Vibrio aquaticus]